MGWDRVLVGVDGSEGSRRALRFAADEAEAHGARLRVLGAYVVPAPPIGIGLVQPAGRGSHAWHADAERRTAETVEAVLGGNPDLEVTTAVVEGPAARALIEESRTSDLVVVGTRGHGGFSGMLLGSVSRHVAAHAACPVAVVK